MAKGAFGAAKAPPFMKGSGAAGKAAAGAGAPPAAAKPPTMGKKPASGMGMTAPGGAPAFKKGGKVKK